MRNFFALIFILILSKSPAGNFDSLLVVSQKLRHDTARINLFYHEGMKQRYADPAYSYHCARQIMQLSENTEQPRHFAMANNLFGILYYRKGDLSTALLYHRRAMENWKEAKFQKGLAVSYTNLANILSDLKNFGLAENYYLRALEINNELGQEVEVDNCLINLGAMNYEAKNFPVAKEYFAKAMQGAKKRNDLELLATAYNNLADVNTVLGEYEDVIANCENSLKIKDLMENEMEKADTYLTLAAACLKLKNENEFLLNMNLADSLIEKFDYRAAKILSLKLKSDFYHLKGNNEAAFIYLNRHVALRDSMAQIEIETDGGASFAEIIEPQARSGKGSEFPYLYMNLLIISAIGSGIFLFRNKR